MPTSPRTRRVVSRIAMAVLILVVTLFVAQSATGNDQTQCPTTERSAG